MNDKPPQRFAPKKAWTDVSKEAPSGPYVPRQPMGHMWHNEEDRPRLRTFFSPAQDRWNKLNHKAFAAKIYKQIAEIHHAYAEGLYDNYYTEDRVRESVAHLLAKLEDHPVAEAADENFTTAVLVTVRRARNEDHLHPDASPTLSAFATNEEEAFHQLLLISGLDAMEIKMHDLTMNRLQGPAGLIEELQKITGDGYDMEMGEIALPLLEQVRAILTRSEPVGTQIP